MSFPSSSDAPRLPNDASDLQAALDAARADAEALRTRVAHYETLFATIDEAFCVCDLIVDATGAAVDYRFVEANPRFEEMTGLVDPVGRTARELVPGLEDHWLDTYARVGLGGETLRLEGGSDAMGRWFDLYAAPAGAPGSGRFAVVFKDVTGPRRSDLHRALLADVDATVRLAHSTDDVLAAALDRLVEALGVSRASFAEIDADADRIEILHSTDADVLPAGTVNPYSAFADGAFGTDVREGRAIVVEDSAADARTRGRGSAFARAGSLAFVTVPTALNGATGSLLSVVSSVPRVWKADEVALVEAVASRVGPAIERARAEAALRASEERFRASQEASLDGFMILEPIRSAGGDVVDFAWAYVNEAAARIVGQPRSWFVGRRMLDVHPGNRETGLFDAYRRVVETGEPFVRELDYNLDGLHLTLRLSVARTSDGIAVTFADLSERRRAEVALEHQSDLTRTVLDNATSAMFMMDTAGRCTYLNPAAIEMTGFTLDELRERPLHDAIHHHRPDGRPYPMAECPIDRALPEKATVRRHEDVFIRKDGTFFPVLVAAEPIERNGVPVGTVVEVRDVSEERRAAASRLASAARDAFRVALADALRPITDAAEIQLEAARLLGHHLGVSRVVYFEVDGGDYVVERSHADGIGPLQGRFPTASFGEDILAAYREGRTLVEPDVAAHLRAEQVAAHHELGIYAFVGAPLVKDGRLLAGLAAHHTAPRAWTDEEVALIEETAERTWAAVVRARAEAALRQSETRLRLAQRAGRIGAFEWRLDTGEVIWSAELEALYGVPEGTFEGTFEAWSARVTPDDARRVRAEVEAALARRQIDYAYEFCAVLPDGARRWFAGQAQFAYDDDGRPQYMIGVNIDDHDRRQAEEALRASDARFRALADAVPQIVWVSDADGAIEYLNERWFAYTGDVPAGADERTRDFVHPDELPALVARYADARRTGDSVEAEVRLRRHDGAYRWHLVRVLRVAGGDRWYGSSTDVHDIREAREALGESEARFRNMADHSPAMIWMTDPDGTCVYLNRRWYEFTGQSEAEALGFGWLDATHPDDAAEAGRVFLAANAANEPFALEYRLRRSDGVYRWCIDAAAPRFGADGAFLGYVGSVVDITDQKEAEAALRRANVTLEARVQERTAALEAANRQLEIRNRELQDFAYVASHDLQEPLRKVQSFADLLASGQGGALSDEGRHYVERMRVAAARMSTLIRDLLAFSRVATQGDAFASVDLDASLAAVLSDLEVRLRESRGTVEGGPLGALVADPTQVRQLLQNLVGNALKFHRPGVPPHVHIEGAREFDHYLLTVTDNGVGFDERHTERIFAPFQRLHARSMYEGTGMGLAIVRRIVERHGGTITATSTPGEGSRFVVRLPQPLVSA